MLEAVIWTLEADSRTFEVRGKIENAGKKSGEADGWTFEVGSWTFEAGSWTFEAGSWMFDVGSLTFEAAPGIEEESPQPRPGLGLVVGFLMRRGLGA